MASTALLPTLLAVSPLNKTGQGKLEDAKFQRALQIDEKTAGPQHPKIASHLNRGVTLEKRDNLADSVADVNSIVSVLDSDTGTQYDEWSEPSDNQDTLANGTVALPSIDTEDNGPFMMSRQASWRIHASQPPKADREGQKGIEDDTLLHNAVDAMGKTRDREECSNGPSAMSIVYQVLAEKQQHLEQSMAQSEELLVENKEKDSELDEKESQLSGLRDFIEDRARSRSRSRKRHSEELASVQAGRTWPRHRSWVWQPSKRVQAKRAGDIASVRAWLQDPMVQPICWKSYVKERLQVTEWVAKDLLRLAKMQK